MRLEHEELVVVFYDEANDHRKETLAQIKKRVLGGDPWPSKTFERAARKMFDLARGKS